MPRERVGEELGRYEGLTENEGIAEGAQVFVGLLLGMLVGTVDGCPDGTIEGTPDGTVVG